MANKVRSVVNVSTCRCQGSQSLVTWVHAGHAVGGDNQLYTMISRAMGSPWAGTLKVTGIKLKKHMARRRSIEHVHAFI